MSDTVSAGQEKGPFSGRKLTIYDESDAEIVTIEVCDCRTGCVFICGDGLMKAGVGPANMSFHGSCRKPSWHGMEPSDPAVPQPKKAVLDCGDTSYLVTDFDGFDVSAFEEENKPGVVLVKGVFAARIQKVSAKS